MQTQTSLTERIQNDFYDKIAQDSKQALIQLVSEAGHGKTSSLRTIIDYCRKKHPDIVFKIFDVSQAWYHCAPTKWRQYVTVEKITNKQVVNIEDCVYEIGSLPPEIKRAFVGTIIGSDYERRYSAKMENKGSLNGFSTLVYIFEEANIYFGSYAMRRNDPYTSIFQNFVSVGRNYSQRGFLVATAEEGEISPSLRRRSRRIYGRLESQGDINRIKRKNKELADYLTRIPRYNFVYYADKAYGPVRVPDAVNHVPEDYVVESQPQQEPSQFDASWWIKFGVGAGITLLAIDWLLNYKW